MLQSKASNYIRLYLKLQRINTKAAWLLPTFTITILLAPYAALLYLLVSLSKIIGVYFSGFFSKGTCNIHKQKLQGASTGSEAHMVLVSKQSQRGNRSVCSATPPFLQTCELAQEKVLFWVVSVACCHARNCEVRFPVLFSAPLQPKRKEGQGESWLCQLWDHGRVRDTFLRTARKGFLQRRVLTRKS